jgi:hypothetical protein
MHRPKRWNIADPHPAAAELAAKLKASPLLAQVLLNRGIGEVEDCASFLRPSLKQLHEPFAICNLRKAAERIAKAIRDGEKIVIYGDYDVDGITATSILWHAITLFGGNVEFYIPHRIDEGYGLNAEAITQICEQGAKLIVTVDCGVTAIEQAKAACERGVDLIITDHHEWKERTEDSGLRTERKRQVSFSPQFSVLSPPTHGTSAQKILFFPDQHLGRNTAYAMGYPLEKMIVWDPRLDLGGNELAQVQDATFVLWKGQCSVHQLFRPEHVDEARAKYPGIKVMVHPECRFEVVEKADYVGSTAYIVKQVEAAPPGSQWAIGTEVHLINRLRQQHPDQQISVLSDCQCLCTTMYRIDLPHLCWALENLVEGHVVNEIKVDATTRKWATVALERMLAIKGTGNPMGKSQPVGTTVD